MCAWAIREVRDLDIGYFIWFFWFLGAGAGGNLNAFWSAPIWSWPADSEPRWSAWRRPVWGPDSRHADGRSQSLASATAKNHTIYRKKIRTQQVITNSSAATQEKTKWKNIWAISDNDSRLHRQFDCFVRSMRRVGREREKRKTNLSERIGMRAHFFFLIYIFLSVTIEVSITINV